MLDDSPVKVGDELVELGKVYTVFKIEDKQGFDGKVQKHVFFKPFFQTSDNQTLSCSIPLENISQAKIRRPLNKKQVNEILSSLPSLKLLDKKDLIFDINLAKEILKTNDPIECARVLRTVWTELNNDDLNPTKSKKDILELSVKTLAQEVALAYDLTLEKAEKKLHRALSKT